MSVNYQLLKEKMVSDFEDYLSLGQKKGYFILDKGKIKYLAVGKSYNFSNPEEKVRMAYYFDLIEKYKYPADRIEFEIGMPDRTPDRYADIVIFTSDEKRNPYIIIECKKDGITDAEFEQATKQAIANARLLKAPFAICVAGNTRRVIKIDKSNNEIKVSDIPVYYEEKDNRIFTTKGTKEEKIEFYNKKNQRITGLISFPKEKKPPIVIIIHGFKGTKEYYPFVNNSIKLFADAGIVVLRMDCRGSGESDLEFKDMTIKSESEDVLTAIDYVKTLDVDSKKIGLIGISLGATAILMAMARKSEVKTLVFWGPAWTFNGEKYFDTSQNRKTIKEEGVFYVKQKFTGKKLIAGKELFEEFTSFDIRPFIKNIKKPILILRGLEDEVVGTEKDKEAVELLNAEYKIIEKGDHNFTDENSEKKLIKLTVDWLVNKLLK